MTAPLVSVVLIFLDDERFLGEAIESVLAQRFRDWELLLVDDGSSDGSTALARRYAGAHADRIRYLDHPKHANRGMSATRNLGVRHARGELIAFLDSDDVWLPQKLERQAALMKARPEVALVYGPAEYWFSWTGNVADAGRDFVFDTKAPPGLPIAPRALVTRILRRECHTPHPSGVMLRREAFAGVGGCEESFRTSHEDLVLTTKVSLRAPVLAASECLFRYRQHPEAYTAAASRGERRAARLRYLRWLRRYLQREGLRGSELWQAAAEQLRAAAPPGGSSGLAPLRRTLVRAGRHMVPQPYRSRLAALVRREPYVPPAGHVRFGDLRRLMPLSRRWGKDRGGMPIDRYYIERFLTAHATDVHGRVLEAGDDTYTRRFGGARVVQRDVLHALQGNPAATIVADLAAGDGIPSAAFDCVILTQVLQMIPDPSAAVRTVYRILRPGGTLLATLPGISQVSRWDQERWGDYWRFTTLAAELLLGGAFPAPSVAVTAHGNVLAAVAFLHGLAAEELQPAELDFTDPDFQLLITARATKSCAD